MTCNFTQQRPPPLSYRLASNYSYRRTMEREKETGGSGRGRVRERERKREIKPRVHRTIIRVHESYRRRRETLRDASTRAAVTHTAALLTVRCRKPRLQDLTEESRISGSRLAANFWFLRPGLRKFSRPFTTISPIAKHVYRKYTRCADLPSSSENPFITLRYSYIASHVIYLYHILLRFIWNKI